MGRLPVSGVRIENAAAAAAKAHEVERFSLTLRFCGRRLHRENYGRRMPASGEGFAGWTAFPSCDTCLRIDHRRQFTATTNGASWLNRRALPATSIQNVSGNRDGPSTVPPQHHLHPLLRIRLGQLSLHGERFTALGVWPPRRSFANGPAAVRMSAGQQHLRSTNWRTWKVRGHSIRPKPPYRIRLGALLRFAGHA